METRKVKLYLDLSISEKKVFDSEVYFAKSEKEIFLDRREIELVKNDRFICSVCKGSLYIRGGVGEDKRQLHFVHKPSETECPQKSSVIFLSKAYINALKFGKNNESDLHKELKLFIAKSLLENEQNNKGVFNVEVEKREYHESVSKDYHIPDVKSHYYEKRIAFELQLSTTFLHEIVKREIFYRDKKSMYLIWIFSTIQTKDPNTQEEFENSDLYKKFTSKDIIYSNYSNVFVINKESMNRSIDEKDLVLRCWYKLGESWENEYVTLSDLKLEEETGKIYYKKEDDVTEKVQIGEEEKKVLVLLKRMNENNLDYSFFNFFKSEIESYSDDVLLNVGKYITQIYFTNEKDYGKLPIIRFIQKILNFDNYATVDLLTLLVDKKIFLLREIQNEQITPLELLFQVMKKPNHYISTILKNFMENSYQMSNTENSNRVKTDLEIIRNQLLVAKDYFFDDLMVLKCAYENGLTGDKAMLIRENIITLKALESIKQGQVIGYKFPKIIQVIHLVLEHNKECTYTIIQAYQLNKRRLDLKESDKMKKIINDFDYENHKEIEKPVYKIFQSIYPSIFILA
jgi:hypothetical protein